MCRLKLGLQQVGSDSLLRTVWGSKGVFFPSAGLLARVDEPIIHAALCGKKAAGTANRHS